MGRLGRRAGVEPLGAVVSGVSGQGTDGQRRGGGQQLQLGCLFPVPRTGGLQRQQVGNDHAHQSARVGVGQGGRAGGRRGAGQDRHRTGGADHCLDRETRAADESAGPDRRGYRGCRPGRVPGVGSGRLYHRRHRAHRWWRGRHRRASPPERRNSEGHAASGSRRGDARRQSSKRLCLPRGARRRCRARSAAWSLRRTTGAR